MHMLSKRVLRSGELDSLRKSRNTTREVQTNEEAQVCVQDLDLFVTVQILEDTAVCHKEHSAKNTVIHMNGPAVKSHI